MARAEAILLARAAQRYARLGYPVFPVQEGEKRPHPHLAPNGFKNASLDPKQIAAWWRACPKCNLGLVLPVGTIALDFDGGQEALDAFLKEFPELRRAPLQRSARRGFHLVLRVPEGVSLPGRVERWGGVDIKAGGRGYILVWPSIVEGKQYAWVNPLTPPEALPEAPPRLLGLLAPPPPPPPPPRLEGASPPAPGRLQALLEAYASRIAATPPGGRHMALLRYGLAAAGLIPLGLDREETEGALREAALAAGLPLREVEDLLRWVLPRGEARPLPLEEAGVLRKPEVLRNALAENLLPSLSQKSVFRNRALHTEGLRKRKGVIW